MFVNINPGASQWPTNLIGYDALHSYGSPSYYAKMMLNQNGGTVVLPTTLTVTGGSKFSESVSQDSQTGTIYIKGVNAANQAQKVNIVLDGISGVAPQATATVLTSASPQDTNTLTQPTKVVPVTSKAKVSGNFEFSFAPYSVTVLAIQTK